MTRQKQRKYRRLNWRTFGISEDIPQWCPRCGHFTVYRMSRKYKKIRDANRNVIGHTNRYCDMRVDGKNCPGPNKGEACVPPTDEIIEKHITHLKSLGDCNVPAAYYEAMLRKRRGEKEPTGTCVVCSKTSVLKRMVFSGRVGGLACLSICAFQWCRDNLEKDT